MLLLTILLALGEPFVSYEVKESVTSSTPRGERVQATVGRVVVSGPRAAWELSGGAFPRSAARAVLADRGAVTLLDPGTSTYAAATREEFDALFLPPAAPQGGASFTPRDVAVTVEPDGAGAPVAGAPTVRWRVDASWRYAMQTPGRAGSVATTLRGSVVAAPGLEEARSPFDDLLRIVPARGEVREALERELARVKGLPVGVELTMESESRSEVVGGAPAPEAAPAAPPRVTTRIVREVTNVVRRRAHAADARLFAVPEGFRSRGRERLLPDASLP